MKKCPSCGFPNPIEAAQCANCEFVFAEGTTAAREAGEEVAEDVGAAVPPPPPPPAPIRLGGPDPGPRATADAPEGPSEIDEEDLLEIEESGLFTIGIIGFATSGKTFFINRLKKFFRQEGGYDPKPPPPPDEGIVEGTINIETHRFFVLETDAEREGRAGSPRFRRDREPFYMIDIPGDKFRNAVEKDLAGEEADTLINVLRLSHALIVVLPADDLLLPKLENEERFEFRRIEREIAALKAQGEGLSIEDRRKLSRLEHKRQRLDKRVDQEKHLEGLLDNIALISAIASELRDEHGEIITRQRYREMSDLERATAYTGRLRGPAPFTYIALAKADRLISPKQLRRVRTAFPNVSDPDLIDLDPGNVVRLHRPKIHQRIVQAFAWHKFDFVTCFEGQPVDEKRIHYWLPHHGVEAVVEWIHWARIYSRKSGRRDTGEKRRLERFRAWWDRMEGRIGRQLASWHESGGRADPARLGLDPGYYRRGRGRALDGVQASLAEGIAKLMDPKGHAGRLALLGTGALLAIVAVTWLMGGFASREQRGYSFAPQPVYAAEIEQMETGAPAFAEGVVDRRLRRWSAVPDDGGWFSFAEGGRARGPLEQALRTIPEEAEPGLLDGQTAENAIGNLQSSASADRRQVRAANSYHEALLRYLAGDLAAAAATFTVARDELERARSEGASGARYEATSSRMAAVRAAIRHGLGTTELVREDGNLAEAVIALRDARAIARDPNSGVRDATALSRFWFPLTTRDPVPIIRLETAEIWTNLLAGLIRAHRLALADDDSERAERFRRELQDLVAQAAEHSDEAADQPRLVANLMIAAARSGAFNTIGSFYLGREPSQDLRSAVGYAQIIADPESSGSPNAQYWKITQRWRELLSPDSGRPRAAARQIAADLQRNRPDQASLRLWLADVMETEYERSSGAARRELTLNYGQYYDGAQWFRYADAYAPFGFILGVLLSLLVVVGFIALWLAFRRVRPIYVKLHVPRHRAERQAAGTAE